MAISFKGAHFPHDIILMGVRWHVAYPLISFDFFWPTCLQLHS